MHVLVIGGTQFFGKAIVEILLDEGHQVTVYSRGNQKPTFWEHVNHIRGDRTDRKDFSRQLSGKSFDTVIDNIAFTPEDVLSALEVFDGNTGRYVFTSALAVHLTTPWTLPLREEDVDHDTDKLPDHLPIFYRYDHLKNAFESYTLGKLWAERVLVRQDRLPYTISDRPLWLVPMIHC